MIGAPFLSRLLRAWDNYFFKPQDTSVCGIVRIAFGLVLIPYVFILGMDLSIFHSQGGLLPFEISLVLIDPDVISPLGWIAPNDGMLYLCFGVLSLQVLLLIFGISSRFQALGVFFWLVSFQHRNNLLIDGGDTLARLTAFYLVCMPCGEKFSVDSWLRSHRNLKPRLLPVWGLKLLQVQMVLLYLSTALLKLSGEKWLDGSALMHIVQLNDLFGRFPLPGFITGSVLILKVMTWLVLVLEILIPIGLIFRRTRPATLCVAVLFHLSLDYSMNLFLFQWFMIVGLLSFIQLDSIPLLRWFNFRERVGKATL
jgi:hypothetical protein